MGRVYRVKGTKIVTQGLGRSLFNGKYSTLKVKTPKGLHSKDEL